MYLYNEFKTNILNDINTLSCPCKNNSHIIELTVHTSCYWGHRLTLCYFLFTGGSIDSSQFPSQSTNSLDISIFSDIERLSQEFRQFQSTFGQNVRELTSFKASATDEIERLSENVNELLELVKKSINNCLECQFQSKN